MGELRQRQPLHAPSTDAKPVGQLTLASSARGPARPPARTRTVSSLLLLDMLLMMLLARRIYVRAA